MMKFSTFCFILGILFIQPLRSVAQTPVVTFTGTTCPGSTITCSSTITPATITWKLGSTILQSDTAAWQTSAFTPVGVTDTPGTTSAYLHGPQAVFVNRHGNIYVVDSANARVVLRTDSTINIVAGTGTPGSSAKQLNKPTGIFVDTAGYIYIADAGNNRIQKWKTGDTVGITVAGSSSGTAGSTAALLNNPIDVFRDALGNLYIADAGNNRIQKWASAASSSSTVAGSSSGTSGTTASLLNHPTSVFVDASANIYIADAGNNRIQKWASAASSGSTVAGSSSGTAGSTASLLNAPAGVLVDGLGTIYISDAGNNRIQKWPSGSSSGITIAGSSSGTAGNTSLLLSTPKGIAFDVHNNIYVADFDNQRVQEFIDTIRNTFIPASTGTYTATVTTFAGNSTSANEIITTTVTPSFLIGSSSSLSTPRGPIVAICPGAKSLNFFVNRPINGGTAPTFQWQVNGVTIDTTDFSTPFIDTVFHRGDTVTCIMTSNLGCAFPLSVNASNVLHLDTVALHHFHISLRDEGYPRCEGHADTFRVSPSGYDTIPLYTWMVNSDTIASGIDSSFVPLPLYNNDTVKVIAYSVDGCAAPRDTSASIIVAYAPTHDSLSVFVKSLNGDSLCAKTNVAIFAAHATHFVAIPTIQWTRNGKNIIGAVKDTLVLPPDSMSNGDRINCIYTSADVCPIRRSTVSATDTMHLLSPGRPAITITDTPNVILTPGTTVKFTAHSVNGGTHPDYVWYKNTHRISGVDTAVYITNDVAIGDVIYCVIFSNAKCLDTFAAFSNQLTMRSNTDVSNLGNLVNKLSLYPNPNQGTFTLNAEFTNKVNAPVTLEVINVLGQSVYKAIADGNTGQLNINVHLNDLAPGIYMLRLSAQDQSSTTRFIIQ